MSAVKITNNIIDASQFTGTMNQYYSNLEIAVKKTARFTINKVAFEIHKNEKAATLTIFEQPVVRFTERAMLYERTDDVNKPAIVRIQRDRLHYFHLEQFGGVRKPTSEKGAKGTTILLPKKVKVNKYKNIPKGKLATLASNKKLYFVGTPSNGKSRTPRPNQTVGLYKREGRGKNKKLKLMIAFTKTTKYKKKFRFYTIANNTAKPGWVFLTFNHKFNNP